MEQYGMDISEWVQWNDLLQMIPRPLLYDESRGGYFSDGNRSHVGPMKCESLSNVSSKDCDNMERKQIVHK